MKDKLKEWKYTEDVKVGEKAYIHTSKAVCTNVYKTDDFILVTWNKLLKNGKPSKMEIQYGMFNSKSGLSCMYEWKCYTKNKTNSGHSLGWSRGGN